MREEEEMPLVELMVPTFNNESTVAETLDSLLAQTYSNIKIVIFDNQSTDKTVEVVQSYLNKGIELVVNEQNLGGEGNFNRCIEKASAPYFCICHSDDIYEPQFVEAQLTALEEVPSASASFCHAERIDAAGKPLGERFLPEELEDQWRNTLDFNKTFSLSMKYGNIFTCPTAFFRTSLFKDNALKFEGSKYKSSSDLGLWLTLAGFGPLLFHTAPLLKYRESSASFSFVLKKARLHRHDMFLVLDDFMQKQPRSEMTSRWLRYFDFLEFKDQMLRTMNVIKTKNWQEWPPKTYSIAKVLAVLFKSNWHFLFGIKAFAIYLLSRPVKLFQASRISK